MTTKTSTRRTFIGSVALGAAGAITALSGKASAHSADTFGVVDSDEWFKKVKGKHRIIYDASEPHAGMPLIWTWAFYKTNNETGSPDNDLTAVVVLRHNAIPFAMEDRLWEKYKLGEVFQVTDNTTKSHATRNPYYVPKEGDFPFPGIDGIKTMQARGAMFCVCNLALTVYSGMVAQKMGLKADEVKNDWLSGILPGVQVVPSGVWAIGRAQEKECAYCYAGG